MFNDNGFDDDDEEDNTLDDISGDEVTRLTVGEINIRLILRFCGKLWMIFMHFMRNSKPTYARVAFFYNNSDKKAEILRGVLKYDISIV